MKLTARQLRRIIREEILQEYDTGGMDPYGFGDEAVTPDEWEQMSGIPLSLNASRQILSVIDPTGTLSVPDVPPALESFNDALEAGDKKAQLIAAAFLILAVLAVIPIAGKVAKLGSAGLKGTIVGLGKAKKLVPPSWGAKVNEFIDKLDDILVSSGRGGKVGKGAVEIEGVVVNVSKVVQHTGKLRSSAKLVIGDRSLMSQLAGTGSTRAQALGIRSKLNKFMKNSGVEITDDIAKAIQSESNRIARYLRENSKLFRTSRPELTQWNNFVNNYNSVAEELHKAYLAI